MRSQATPDAGATKRGRLGVKSYRGPKLELPPHPEAPDPLDLAAVRRWARSQRASNLTAIDLFCGAGGVSLCLGRAGFRVLVGADIDQSSLETHVANIGGLGYHGDLSDPYDFLDHLRAWG